MYFHNLFTTSDRDSSLSPVSKNFTRASDIWSGARKPEGCPFCLFPFCLGSSTTEQKENKNYLNDTCFLTFQHLSSELYLIKELQYLNNFSHLLMAKTNVNSKVPQLFFLITFWKILIKWTLANLMDVLKKKSVESGC